MNKKVLFFPLLLSLSAYAWADNLNNFEQIKSKVKHGKQIKLVVDFSGCKVDKKTLPVIGYIKPEVVIMQENHLSFANSHFTTNNPQYINKPILENMAYKITQAGKVIITKKLIQLSSYQLIESSIIQCELAGNSVQVFD